MLNLHVLTIPPKTVSLTNLTYSVADDTTALELRKMFQESQREYNRDLTTYRQCLEIRYKDIQEHCLTLNHEQLASIVAKLLMAKPDKLIHKLLG